MKRFDLFLDHAIALGLSVAGVVLLGVSLFHIFTPLDEAALTRIILGVLCVYLGRVLRVVLKTKGGDPDVRS